MNVLRSQIYLAFLGFILFLSTDALGQLGIFLQIELVNSPKTIKFSSGDMIEFKTKRFPNDWQKAEIKQILVDDQVIMFDYDFIPLDDFTSMRIQNKPASAMGFSLLTFGTTWTGYGLIASIFTDFQYRGRDLVIGAMTLGSGLLINKFFRFNKYNLKKGARLKIVDVRFKA